MIELTKSQVRLVSLLANLKTHWRNWQVRGTGKAYRALTKAMRDDPSYAHSWQCNIAMPILDGAKGKLTHAEANAIADALMAHLFEVKKPPNSDVDCVMAGTVKE